MYFVHSKAARWIGLFQLMWIIEDTKLCSKVDWISIYLSFMRKASKIKLLYVGILCQARERCSFRFDSTNSPETWIFLSNEMTFFKLKAVFYFQQWWSGSYFCHLAQKVEELDNQFNLFCQLHIVHSALYSWNFWKTPGSLKIFFKGTGKSPGKHI